MRMRGFSGPVPGRLAAAWSTLARVTSSIGEVARRVRASVWPKPLLKAFAVLCALVVLAWFGGRAAHTASAAAPETSTPALESAAPLASVAASVATAAPAPSHSSPPARATEDAPVYLNIATVDDLRRLPGIGPKRAQAILDLRGKQGRFRQIEDLMKVRGIGRTTLRRLRPLVRLDPPPIADAGAG